MLKATGLHFVLILLSFTSAAASADEVQRESKPNVLWITSEDNAAHWMGCYGNSQAATPHIDKLASQGLLFTRAYSNAPVCAVARSTLLRGAYAVTTGTQHMRSRYRVPDQFEPYVNYLRKNGYYCTNNRKTDYNSLGRDAEIWDECNNKAHYKNRQPDQPFFAIFNITTSHESSLFPGRVKRNRDRGLIPNSTRIKPKDLRIPPYLPNLPEIRQDFAIYHDVVSAMDAQVGKRINELQERGLADNTIVFYYSDHGGPTPRGKRYLKDTGVRVPLVIRVPDKWKQLSEAMSGNKVDRPVAFVDFAPTLLSICGIKIPDQMQGTPFLGTETDKPSKYVFLFGDRFDDIYGMRRGLTDGRFKYIRRFSPQLPAAPYSYYQFSMPAWIAWRKAWQTQQLSEQHARPWEPNQAVEELFDTVNDPWEIHNLAASEQHFNKLSEMRSALKKKMISVQDSGIIPETFFPKPTQSRTVFDLTQKKYHGNDLIDLVFKASERKTSNIDALLLACEHQDPIFRYWGAVGCNVLQSKTPERARIKIRKMIDDNSFPVRVAASVAMNSFGQHDECGRALAKELNNELSLSQFLTLSNAFTSTDSIEYVPDQWIESVKKDSDARDEEKEFVQRIVARRDQ